MSLINEALKQAQRQNQSGADSLGVPVYHQKPKRNLRNDVLVILLACSILIVLLGGALCGILYTQSKNKQTAENTSKTEAASKTTAPAALPTVPLSAAQSSLGQAREKATGTIQQVANTHREIEETPPHVTVPASPSKPAAPSAATSVASSPTPSAPLPQAPPGIAPLVSTPAPLAPVPSPSSSSSKEADAKSESGEVKSALSPALLKLKTSLKLTGIIGKPGAFVALLNNRLVRTGDVVEGATVTAITAEQVQFNLNGEILEIPIRSPESL